MEIVKLSIEPTYQEDTPFIAKVRLCNPSTKSELTIELPETARLSLMRLAKQLAHEALIEAARS